MPVIFPCSNKGSYSPQEEERNSEKSFDSFGKYVVYAKNEHPPIPLQFDKSTRCRNNEKVCAVNSLQKNSGTSRSFNLPDLSHTTCSILKRIDS